MHNAQTANGGQGWENKRDTLGTRGGKTRSIFDVCVERANRGGCGNPKSVWRQTKKDKSNKEDEEDENGENDKRG